MRDICKNQGKRTLITNDSVAGTDPNRMEPRKNFTLPAGQTKINKILQLFLL